MASWSWRRLGQRIRYGKGRPGSTPIPGDYVAVALPFADPPGASSTSFTDRGFVVGPDARNLTVSPANPTASSGVPFTVKPAGRDSIPRHRISGSLSYVDGSGTLVEIN
mgnify:CR=1 FL=1